MQTVDVRKLKIRLSACLRAVASGETVLVTRRGKVVAEIVAPRPSQTATVDERVLGELDRQGLLTRARIAPGEPLPRRRPQAPLNDVLRHLEASRSER